MPSYAQKEKKPAVTKREADEMAADAAADQEAVEKAQASEVQSEDDLMDEIDGLLEENDVLVNYRQKGGE